MFLKIRNLGMIESADVEINSVTVIAGENNTGKSTVGKALFCLFNSLYGIERQTIRERRSLVSRTLESLILSRIRVGSRIQMRVDNDDFANSIVVNKDKFITDNELLKEELRTYIAGGIGDFVLDSDLNSAAEKIADILNVSDKEVQAVVLLGKLAPEFGSQINNFHNAEEVCKVTLKIKDSTAYALIEKNKIVDFHSEMSLKTEVIYIDDPYAVDRLGSVPAPTQYRNHRDHLRSCLAKSTQISVEQAFSEILVGKKLENIFFKLNTVCPGELVKEKNRYFAYKANDSTPLVDMASVSTGLKTFIIIKTLLMNGKLEENGTLILDEPEIHLHPEWQLVFAELIVLLQKEFRLHVLINTHSPYFLNAIEVYSHKHGVDRCKYYLAEAENGSARFHDVSENLEEIYAKLAEPFQKLENERYAE